MDTPLRFILRLFLVPLGGVLAIVAGIIVLAVAFWIGLLAFADASADVQQEWSEAFVTAVPMLVMFLAIMAKYSLTVAAIGVLISEAFALRSWIYHTANGALAAWIGWSQIPWDTEGNRVFTNPTTLIAAGLAGGLAYWAIAGWSAGFWKPTRQPAGVQRPNSA